MELDRIRNHFADYRVVLKPDRDQAEWWAGAPSVAYDGETFWLAARMREGQSPRGRRGYEVRMLRSADGVEFEPVFSLAREIVALPGFERPCLLRDDRSGRWKLYLCGQHPREPGWHIYKLDEAERPDRFDAESLRVCVAPADVGSGVESIKDPFVFQLDGGFLMFLIGGRERERPILLRSEDGESWQTELDPVLPSDGWHNFYTRPACLMPLDRGYLLVYEGSHESWHDPVYNIATGLAYTPDLRTYRDLTPEAPLLESPTPGSYRTWRYSHWLRVGEEVIVYAEVACPNDTNEIRSFRLPVSLLAVD